MRKSTRNIILIAITVVLVLAIAYVVAPVVAVVMAIKPIVDRADRGQDHLFYETDYEELLTACRELSQRVAEGDLKPKQYRVFCDEPDPNVSTFPQVILDLEPMLVYIETDGMIDLQLLPAFNFFGVRASPKGQEGWGDVKLIEGLWYYAADYRG